LDPGKHRLDGYEAMGFVRYRKDVESDFGRQTRQKEFLASFKQAVWRDPFRLPEVAEIGRNVLNGAMTNDEIASLAFFARSLGPTGIELGMIPVRPGRGSNLRVDSRKLPAVLAAYGLIDKPRTELQAYR
jgi:anionic cell wall polymer biosynthesis LytR-Cps2A-Psr (LCP) family protein